MEWFDAPGYWLTRLVIQRSVGVIYLIAFVVARNQFRPLLGGRGLLPVPRFVAAVPFRASPSLFHLRYSDRLLAAVSWTGIVLSLAVVAGLVDVAPLGVGIAAWLVLWVLYLSIVNVGQVFYAFGWESLLLETGFLVAFLGNARTAPPALVLWLLRWLAFRVEFGAGLIKLRGDPCWRDLTCLHYHHETQPLPGPLSWYFHRLPGSAHRVEVAANHVAQLVLPFGLFAPQPVAAIAAGGIVVTQLWLVLSGNFSWLNVLTIVLALAALPDGVFRMVLPVEAPALVDPPAWFVALVVVVAALVVVLSWRPVRNMLSRRQRMNMSFNPLHLVNTYGAFGSITKERYEIVLEGTADPSVGPGTTWREYGFRAKPGDPRRRPPLIAPYHLRLDWLMWFAAMGPAYRHPWLARFVARLLEGDRAASKLLRVDPFRDGDPPRFVRALLYRYRFTRRRERRESGAWWERTLVDEYLSPMTLDRGEVATDAGRRSHVE